MADEFPIKYSERTPSGKGPSVTANIDVRTGGRELAEAYTRLGLSVASVGRELVQDAVIIQRQEDAVELSELKRKVDEQGYALFNSATGDEDADKTLWGKFEEGLGNLQSKRSNVNKALQKHINNVLPGWENAFAKKGLAIRRKNAKDKFEFEAENLLAQGNLLDYFKQLKTRLALKDISQAEYEAKVKNAPNDSIIEQMRLHIGSGNPALAIDVSKQMKNASADQMEYRNRLIKMAEVGMKKNAEEANKQLTDLMAKKELNLDEVQKRRSILSDDDYQQWTKIALNPPDKRGNLVATTELKSVAMDIWRGTITREDFERRVRDSLADENGINEEQYAGIMADADRELKNVQAEDIRRFSRDAANVILGQYSGVMQFDALGNLASINLAGLSGNQVEDVKYRMHFLSLYEQGLRDFIAENPKASGKDFYQFAAEQKMRYWNTSLESMKNIAKKQGKGGLAQQPKQYKKGDIRVINGTTYTFDGKKWNY